MPHRKKVVHCDRGRSTELELYIYISIYHKRIDVWQRREALLDNDVKANDISRNLTLYAIVAGKKAVRHD